MELVTYPDERLRHRCKRVTAKDRKSLAKLAREMYPFMLEHDGAGLAAPQVGVSAKFFVIKEGLLPFKHRAAVNPRWLPTASSKEYSAEEGCLSFPGLFLEVRRYTQIQVEYEDWRGRMYQSVLEGFAAQVFQHEVDHLNGKLMTDHFTKLILSERV